MAFDAGIRRKLLNLIADTLRAKPYFKRVKLHVPKTAPGKLDGPQAYVTLGPERSSGATNKEKDSEFRIHVVVFVESAESVELEKVDAVDKAEAALMALQTSASFTALADTIDMENVDYDARALAIFGIDYEIAPPIGVARLDMVILFHYTAID